MSGYMKISTIVTLGFLAMLCWHFGTVFGLFGVAPVARADIFLRVAIIVGVVMVFSFVSSLWVQKNQGAPTLPDEREEKIERMSEMVGVLTIYAGLLCLMWFAFVPMDPVQVANGILAVVFATELAKLICTHVLLRRGAV